MYSHKYHTQDLSKLSFLITGGAGFIGSNIVEYLLKYDAKKVVVLDNFSNGHRKNIDHFLSDKRFILVEGDIRDIRTCRNAVEEVDFVLHQAALGSVPRSIKDPITSNEVNVSGFLNVLKASQEANVKKMVYAASSSTYGDSKKLPKVENVIGKPLSPYAITKYVNELYADIFSQTYGFHTVGLRYFNVFGPRQDPSGAYAAVIPLFFDAAINNKEVFINGDGEQTRDFTFVENVVQANIKSLFTENESHEVYNVAFGERISINDLWIQIKSLTNSSVDAKYRESRKGDVRDSLADIEKARAHFNYNPGFNLIEGLRTSLKFYDKT